MRFVIFLEETTRHEMLLDSLLNATVYERLLKLLDATVYGMWTNVAMDEIPTG